jgi:toxin-antitoxin system PIN domain toxin
VIALDTNILVYADTPSSPFHAAARALLIRLTEGSEAWAIPWPCIYEFLRVVTHPRANHHPLPLEVALDDVRQIQQSPSLRLLSETSRHAEIMDSLLRASRVTSDAMFDARIAALCVEHGVGEILTADKDFRRFPLKATNPFL